MTDPELFDRFLYWLDQEYSSYKPEEIEALWEEFIALPVVQPWEEL